MFPERDASVIEASEKCIVDWAAERLWYCSVTDCKFCYFVHKNQNYHKNHSRTPLNSLLTVLSEFLGGPPSDIITDRRWTRLTKANIVHHMKTIFFYHGITEMPSHIVWDTNKRGRGCRQCIYFYMRINCNYLRTLNKPAFHATAAVDDLQVRTFQQLIS